VIIDVTMNPNPLWHQRTAEHASVGDRDEHAMKTIANHVRPDGGTYHASITIRQRERHRQSTGICGRVGWQGTGVGCTGSQWPFAKRPSPVFETAQRLADLRNYILRRRRTGISALRHSDAQRDASSVAIGASGSIELSTLTTDLIDRPAISVPLADLSTLASRLPLRRY
jgi:hypothetical protein